MKTWILGLVAALTLAVAAPAAELRDPFAGPLEVQALAHRSAQPGGFAQADLALLNHATEASIDVVATHALVRWADGSVMRLDLGGKRVHLEPGGGLLQFLFLAIPPDAPLGIATVEIRAHVAHVTPVSGPGGLGHAEFAGDGQAMDVAAFMVTN